MYSIVFLVLSLLLCLNYLIGASYCCSYIGSIWMHVSRFSVTSVSGRVSVVHSCFVMFLPCCCCFLYYWHIISHMPYTFSVAFAMQCYASVVYAVVLCLSVHPSICLSQASILSQWLDESSWFLAWRLPSTYPTLCYKEILLLLKIRVLPSRNLSETSDLENFATPSQSCCQPNSLSSSTVEFIDIVSCTFFIIWQKVTPHFQDCSK